MMNNWFENDTTFLFIGDSITDFGGTVGTT